MSPSITLCFIYILCFMFSFINWDIWDMDNYSYKAAWLIALTVSVFSIVGIGVDKIIFGKKRFYSNSTKKSTVNFIEVRVESSIIVLNSFFCIVTILWTLIIVIQTRGAIGLSQGEITSELSVPTLLNLFQRYVYLQGYFFAFVVVYNIIVRKFRASDIWMLFAIFSTCFLALLSGSRMEVLKVISFILIALYIIWRKKYGWYRNVNFKFVCIGLLSICVVLVLFYQLRYFKSGDSTEFTPLYYISMYIGAPIKLFDLYINNPIYQSSIWGKESFSILNGNLVTLGLRDTYIVRHLEFRGIGNLSLGNVYGAPRRYYQDFGVGGLITLVAILSFFFHILYGKIKNTLNRGVNFFSLIYCYLFTSIIMFPIDDIFYSQLSIGYVLNIIYLYIFYVIIIKKNIVFKW
ncbi:O-antigen polymerase [Rossellomorea marisflavi]|uniref:O-antigen polymerase n=1 Tax=Rossellomorea marisflavi TaxID=189381 RepID=UPI0025B22174|nr:O-antigen polymerase [Rossellomorea marisflavi]WJV19354.1 O-antigen polymerase [Rossellomorea marisflavi]